MSCDLARCSIELALARADFALARADLAFSCIAFAIARLCATSALSCFARMSFDRSVISCVIYYSLVTSNDARVLLPAHSPRRPFGHVFRPVCLFRHQCHWLSNEQIPLCPELACTFAGLIAPPYLNPVQKCLLIDHSWAVPEFGDRRNRYSPHFDWCTKSTVDWFCIRVVRGSNTSGYSLNTTATLRRGLAILVDK